MRILRSIAGMFVLFVLLSSSVFAGDAVNLTGTWDRVSVGHYRDRGFFTDSGKEDLVVIEQKDGAFFGKKTWVLDGKKAEEGFSGVMSADGKRLYVADHVDGLSIGEVIGPDEFVLYYLESGLADSPMAMRSTFTRKK
jgi:hypothetical protein